ncbi:hypothetical protein SEA_PUPPER_206 [Gordonia phage Pupper]|uniref:Uncharacterized protein n=1 Tax=Gordonia phage Pupper TaxID=2571249 RepID=A0A4Y6EJP5_9CAUD|nr:hypothetical protein KHQ83_gp071 [Gordonia phage Pupper]QDF18692.1 hypothetical protein SEA_PUPPER_206 [Gordonia phage Pupper]QDF18924.1 hypothetical protein SEA_SCENTAE_205 [Gordonia phage SCentae]
MSSMTQPDPTKVRARSTNLAYVNASLSGLEAKDLQVEGNDLYFTDFTGARVHLTSDDQGNWSTVGVDATYSAGQTP